MQNKKCVEIGIINFPSGFAAQTKALALRHGLGLRQQKSVRVVTFKCSDKVERGDFYPKNVELA